MAVTVERLIATLEARFDKYDKALNKALGNTDRTFTRIERRGKQMEARLANIGGNFNRKLAGAFALAASGRGAQNLLDSATKIENALKVAGLAGEELKSVYDSLYLSAQRNGAPLEALVSLYSRSAMAAENLGASQEKLKRFSDTVAMSLRVSGQSATEAGGALLQLGQLLGGNAVQAQEYNSLIDGAYPLLQAVAAGLKEAGGDVAKLTRLVKAGEVPVKAFFDAALAGSKVLEGKLKTSVFTISQRFQNLRNALVDAAGRFDESAEAGDTFGAAIDDAARQISEFDAAKFAGQIKIIIDSFNDGATAARRFMQDAGAALGLDNIGAWITGGAAHRSFLGGALTVTSDKLVQDRITAAFEQQVAQAGNLTADAIRESYFRGGGGAASKTDRLPAASGTAPVTLKDYELPGDDDKGKGKKSRLDDYQREVEQIERRAAAIIAETEAMRGLNPLIEDYGYTLEFAAAKQELLAGAQEAGREITPQLAAEIEQLAHYYATASAEAERLAEEQDRVRESAEEMRDLGKDVMGGFINDLKAGKSGAEALSNALQKVADKLMDIALNDLFDGKGGGGFLGSIFSGLFGPRDPWAGLRVPKFATGTNFAPGGMALVGEKGPELVNLPRGSQVIPNHKLGGTTVDASSTIIIHGNTGPNEVAELKAMMRKRDAEMPGTIIKTIQEARRRNVKV